MNRLENDVPKPSSRIAGVPSLIDAIVATATSSDVNERFADAREFLAALDDVAEELNLPAYLVPVPHNSAAARTAAAQIGRASCRERACGSVGEGGVRGAG